MDTAQTQALYAALLKDVSHNLSLWIESQRDLGAVYSPHDDPAWPAVSPIIQKHAASPAVPQPASAPSTHRMPVQNRRTEPPADGPQSERHHGFCAFDTFNSLRQEKQQPCPETPEERNIALRLLNAQMTACHKCMLGGKSRGILTGRGPIDPLMMFIAAGANPAELDCDKFLCGDAAELLEKMVSAMSKTISDKINVDHIYMTNIIKCACLAPKCKRDDIARCCIKWLREEIAIVRPQIIVVWGEFAYHAMFGGNANISQVRGQWKTFEGIPVMPTHHPIEMLHNPQLKRRVWPDLLQVGNALKLN